MKGDNDDFLHRISHQAVHPVPHPECTGGDA